jgi:uncharacterized protein (DUF779 family)
VRVTGTDAAARIVERSRRDRHGELVFTIGTGCCESTAPFLYEDFWPGPDHEQVGEVAGVAVFAPALLRNLYPGDDGVVIDVDDGLMAESMSIETEYGCRFVLRGDDRSGSMGSGGDRAPGAMDASESCDVPEAVSALRSRGRQDLPEALRRVRMR